MYYPYESQRDDCAHCGERLTVRQERFCGPACRVASHRATKPRTCALCGSLFTPEYARQKLCGYADIDEHCRALQDEIRAAEATAERDVAARRTNPCAHCGNAVQRASAGRVAKYCDHRCKQSAYYARKRAQSA